MCIKCVQDSDVYAERKKVLSGGTEETDVVVIKNLVKVPYVHVAHCYSAAIH